MTSQGCKDAYISMVAVTELASGGNNNNERHIANMVDVSHGVSAERKGASEQSVWL